MAKYMSGILQDWATNSGNWKARLVLVAFRLAVYIRALPKPLVLLLCPYLVLYRVGVEWGLGIELPWKLQVGPGLRLFHGVGLVVHDRAVIGARVVLRHCTTIGVRETSAFGSGAAPVLEDEVDVGSNAVIVGPVRIGRGACFGAGAIVTKGVPAGATAVGNPARIVSKQ